MIKRIAAAGVSDAAVAALSYGMFASPAHADVVCTDTTLFIQYANGASECTQGHDVTFELSGSPIEHIRAGDTGGFLVRGPSGQFVAFQPGQVKSFGAGG